MEKEDWGRNGWRELRVGRELRSRDGGERRAGGGRCRRVGCAWERDVIRRR